MKQSLKEAHQSRTIFTQQGRIDALHRELYNERRRRHNWSVVATILGIINVVSCVFWVWG